MECKDLFGLEGKNVVITGAGSGMGKAAAKLLVDLGANVYATVRSKPLDFAVSREIQVDLSSQEGVDACVRQLPNTIEALFVCHGISNTQKKTNALEVQLTNFLSFQALAERLLPRINDNGSVTFISSNGGREWQDSISACLELIACKTWDDALDWYCENPDETNEGYVFAKKCQHVYVMSKVHAPEFIDRKIRINAVAPGMTLTGLTDNFNKSIDGNAESGKAMLEGAFLSFWSGRWASPEEMGHPLVVVGSRISSYMSGQIIYLDYGTSSLRDFQKLCKGLELARHD